MTTMGELEELEPLDDGAGVAMAGAAPTTTAGSASMMEAMLQAQRAGLPAPAHNPRADKVYFRFLFAGLVMTIGCLMPFGPEWQMSGYKTMSGAFFLLIALGVVWSAWGAIHTNRLEPKRMKWILLAFLPFVVQIMNMIGMFDEPAIKDAIAGGKIPICQNWGELGEILKEKVTFNKDPMLGLKLDNTLRYFGTGKIFVLFGAFLCEFFFLGSIFGATKVIKQQKAAAMAARKGM